MLRSTWCCLQFQHSKLLTFEENLKYKGDLLMTIYFDFETTAPSDTYYDPEQKEMFVVSYITIIAFHQKLIGLNRVICERSLGYSYQKLNIIDYFTDDQICHVDVNVVKQLKDAACRVASKKCKKALGQMFSIELYLIKQTLATWFNKKFKSQNLQLNALAKTSYEKLHPIDWSNQKCCLCNFKLDVAPTSFDTSNGKMTYGDFYIRYEHKFLRNIYSQHDL